MSARTSGPGAMRIVPGTVPGPLDDPGAEQGDGLGVVEAHAPLEAVAGDHAGDGEEELLGV